MSCLVCGKPYGRAGAFGGPVLADHDLCHRDVQRWQEESDHIRTHHPGYMAVEEAVASAEAERDRVYRDAMIAAGIPEWYAKNRVEDLYER